MDHYAIRAFKRVRRKPKPTGWAGVDSSLVENLEAAAIFRDLDIAERCLQELKKGLFSARTSFRYARIVPLDPNQSIPIVGYRRLHSDHIYGFSSKPTDAFDALTQAAAAMGTSFNALAQSVTRSIQVGKTFRAQLESLSAITNGAKVTTISARHATPLRNRKIRYTTTDELHPFCISPQKNPTTEMYTPPEDLKNMERHGAFKKPPHPLTARPAHPCDRPASPEERAAFLAAMRALVPDEDETDPPPAPQGPAPKAA